MVILSFLKYLRGIFNTTLQSETVHHAIIQSIYDAFIMVDNDLNIMRLEICLSTATGKWLDHWGDFFAVHRKLNETDSAYAKRIIEYVIRPKTTVPAIKDHIVEFLNDKYHTDYTTKNVDIKEPWKELAKYSHQGLLSSTTRFFSGNYYCHSVIDVSVPEALTQDLIDLVMAVKAAGVKVIWSFLNSYDIVSGYTESNNNWANYIRHVLTQTQRNTYGGLLLSNTSLYPTLSGRREIWFELHTLYCWYARMMDKDTDKSIIITKNDLAALLDYYEQIDQIFSPADTGLKVSVDGVLSNLKMLSGDITESEAVTRLINMTQNIMESLQLVDDWLTLSYKGKLSTSSGILFKFEASHELLSKILATIDKFKQENRDYYNALQPPILMGEQAQYLVPRNNNWLFNTPTMSQQDFYDLWEITDSVNLQDIYDYEQNSEKRYLTFGDVYQPPIVIAGSPWDWTPIIDSPWLWASATLTSEELEEIYRMKFSGFPDLVEIQTTTITHPENNFTLSESGKLSESEYSLTTRLVRSSEPSFRLSKDGKLSSSKVVSGEKIKAITDRVKNENFARYTFLSGDESTVTKHYVVTENTPTLETLIEFEENQDIFNPNEKIQYSTRDWMQAPIQIGEFAQWLIASHTKQLWDTWAITNEEIMSFWNEEPITETIIQRYLTSGTVYQPPIVMADRPFYWLNTQDIPWLWKSATLNNEELEEVYREKFSEHPELFPDVVTTTQITQKNPVNEFRLSDNGHMPDNHVQVDVTEIKHPELGFTLSQNSIISNRKTEYRTTIEMVPHPENSFRLSHNSEISATRYNLEITTINHSENNFILSSSGLDKTYQVSGGIIEQKHNWVENPQFPGYHFLSGDVPEIVKTVDTITHEELPLKFMSGGKTDVTTAYSLVLDGKGTHRLSGDKSTYTEQTNVEEKVVTLGTLIDWEEQQPEVLYSTRYILQSQIMISLKDQVLWLIKPDFTQLWNTPVILNKDIRDYWSGNSPFISLKKFQQIILEDSTRYQAPIERRPKPFDWTISIQENRLWNSPTISNAEMLFLWQGDDAPSTEDELEEYILQLSYRYQPPIVMMMESGWYTTIHDTPWLWSSITLTQEDLEEIYNARDMGDTLGNLIHLEEHGSVPYSPRGLFQSAVQFGRFAQGLATPHIRQLWDTLVMTNEEIMSFWDKEGTPRTKKKRIEQYLQSSTIYQPPIVMADRPFYWLNTQDIPWLWKSATLNNEELEEVYREKFSEQLELLPKLFPDIVTVNTILQKNPVNEFRLSDNGHMPDNYVQIDVTEVKHPELGFVLSHNSVISNRKTEYRITTETIPRPENSFKLSSNGTISARKYNLEITTINHSENNFILSSSGLDKTYQVSGGIIEQKHNWVENPQFSGYRRLSGDAPEIIKTTETITHEELPLKFMSGGKTDVTTAYSLVLDGKGTHRLSGDKSEYVEQITIEKKEFDLDLITTWEEQQSEVLYSTRYVLQSPVSITPGEPVMWVLKVQENQLWNSPVIPNKEIRNYWVEDTIPSMLKLKRWMSSESTRYQAPIERRPKPFDWTIKVQDVLLENSPVISLEEMETLWLGDNAPNSLPELQEHLNQSNYCYQPPITVSMDQGYNTTITNTTWLWSSATLKLEELEEVYTARGMGNTLGNLIHLEEHGSIDYSPRGLFQSPIQIQPQ